MRRDTDIANAHTLVWALENLGFVADIDGTTVAFADEYGNPATAKITGRVALVTVDGTLLGTQTFSTVDDLADTLAVAFREGHL